MPEKYSRKYYVSVIIKHSKIVSFKLPNCAFKVVRVTTIVKKNVHFYVLNIVKD